ncbi:PKD domain-containing protein [Halobiforma nitratireducens]|uniref:CARDB domain-containing protein n=1 Tax=Halobiforma nitratireducens JCM 10879 TaxID=1227454 RepID=M0LXE9_9EURY|nr:PKD domain-containing protein [Halobiforma nitratireducens]EMA37853.1 CARDB domain-containing protein [Halobiforma nitratireducens JCM 10879]
MSGPLTGLAAKWALVVGLLALLVAVTAVPAIAGAEPAAVTGDDEQRTESGQLTTGGVDANEDNDGNNGNDGDEEDDGDGGDDGEDGNDDDDESDEDDGDDGDNGDDEDDENETAVEPTAVVDAPDSIGVGTTVTLDASDSEPEDEIESYNWTIHEEDGTYLENTSVPTLEYTFDDPGDKDVFLEVETDEKRAATSTVVDVEKPTVTGSVVHHDGDASASDKVALYDGDEAITTAETADDGSFTLPIEEPGTYGLIYRNDDLLSGESDFDPDGRVDLYAIETITVDDGSADIGTVTLPEPNDLEIVVVGSESDLPVENATVTYTHEHDGVSASTVVSTGEEGYAPAEEETPIGVVGDIDIEIETPDGFIEESVSESMTVNRDTQKRIELQERINASLAVEQEPVPVGENVTVTLEENRGTAQTISWTVGGERTTETQNRSIDIVVTGPKIDNETVDIAATVTGVNGKSDDPETSVPVNLPELQLNAPERTNAYESFTATASYDTKSGEIGVERYDWQLYDENGSVVDSKRPAGSSVAFAVDSVGNYTIDLSVRDESDYTVSANTTVEVDTVPSWVEFGASYVEIEDVSAPSSVETGETVSITVTATNVGEEPDVSEISVANETALLEQRTVELGDGETDTVTLEYTAPDRPGNDTLSISTGDDRASHSYTVVANSSSNATANGDGENGTADGPQQLDLLPTPAVGAEVSGASMSSDRLGTVLLGTATTTILGGFGLLGYVVYTRPRESGAEWLLPGRE